MVRSHARPLRKSWLGGASREWPRGERREACFIHARKLPQLKVGKKNAKIVNVLKT